VCIHSYCAYSQGLGRIIQFSHKINIYTLTLRIFERQQKNNTEMTDFLYYVLST